MEHYRPVIQFLFLVLPTIAFVGYGIFYVIETIKDTRELDEKIKSM